MGILGTILIGGIAGWLAGQIRQRRGFGILRNIVIGVIGSFLGRLLFSVLGLSANAFLGEVIMSTIGALLLLYLINAVIAPGGGGRRRRR